MEISESMLAAAVSKATEAGLFPRHTTPCDKAVNREIMRAILMAAIEATEDEAIEMWTTPQHDATTHGRSRQRRGSA